MKKFLFIAGFILIICLILFFRREPILMAIGNFLIVQDNLQPADVIHVIAGEDYRTDYAIQLYKQDLGKTIFFTGGWCVKHQVYHGQHGLALSLAAGVPRDAVAFDDTSVTSTYAEAEKLKAWIDQSPVPIRSVIVVSDPFHMRRARWTYQQVLGAKVKIEMAPVPFEKTPFQLRWWTDEASRDYVRDEYEKIAYYIARYQLAWGPVKDWLATLDTE